MTNRVPKAATAAVISIMSKDDFEKVNEHLNVIRKTIKEKRVEVAEDENLAMLQVDWAENGEVVVQSEAQRTFYGGRLYYNLHTSDNSGGFVKDNLLNTNKNVLRCT